jgi:mono/diheme cytochrome c family protein
LGGFMLLVVPKSFSSKGLWGAVALLLLLGGSVGATVALSQSSDTAPAASQISSGDPAALIARGKYLTDAADCMPCHTGPGHAPFTGGLILNTPFGGLASPNITPDKETGIGNWSPQDFWNALHNGTRPGRSYVVFPTYLYPAMPFTSYAKLTYPDVMAIRAYIFSLAPQHVAPTPSSLAFPFNQRPVLLGWRILFFSAAPIKMDPSWNENVKNGAYLTEALGHCGECHTPRNILSGLILDQSLAGAPIDDFYAPNISSDKTYGVGGWSTDDLVAYLYNDGNMTKGSAYGPMGEVVQYSLSQLPKSDIQDIALYLQTIVPPRSTPPANAPASALATADDLGATVYAANCAGCHGQAGAGRGPIIPPLAGNSSVQAAAPTNVIGAVLGGLAPWNNGPAMPAFAAGLSDTEIAALTNYVRTSWGNKAPANATPADVMAARAVAAVVPMADAMSDQFGCPHVSSTGGNSALTDPGGGLLEMMTGATPETLPNRTRALVTALRASNSSISNADLSNYLVAAYCPVIANQSGLSKAEKEAALENFIAGAQPIITASAPKPN